MTLSVDLGELIRRALESRIQDIWTTFPARVEAYNSTTRTADVLPMIRRPLSTEGEEITYEDLPVLTNVPIRFPIGTGGTFAISWPITSGDFVDVHVTTYSIAGWRRTGQLSDTGDVRAHAIGNAYATPGACPNSQSLPQAAINAIVLNGPEIRLGSGATSFAALATLVTQNLNAIQATLLTGTVGGNPVVFGTPYTASDVAATKTKVE